MHDSFEKGVQKKMEELNLSPSAPVWEKIELEIRPEKKRRKVFYWLFLGLLLIGGGFITNELFYPSKQTTSNVAAPVERTSINKQSSPTPLTENKITPAEKTTLNEPITLPSLTEKETSFTESNIANKQKTLLPLERKEHLLTSTSKHSTAKDNKLAGPPEELIVNKKTVRKNDPENLQPQITKEAKPELSKNSGIAITDTIAIATTSTITSNDSVALPQEKLQQPNRSTDSLATKKIAANSKWKKQIIIAVGSSGYGSISIFKGYAMADANATPSTAAGAGNGVVRRPSDVKNGLTYSAGFSLAKSLSKHFEVSFGIQYTQYSTSLNVGSNRRTDTILQSSAGNFAANQYYTNTNANNKYVNRFHALEVPITVSYKPVLKVPVFLSVGAAYGRLLSTNALTYSGTSNVYYQDKNSYVHQMVPVFSSIEAELFGKKKTSFRIGPFLQYNLLKIKKENSGTASHLVFAGIKSSIIF